MKVTATILMLLAVWVGPLFSQETSSEKQPKENSEKQSEPELSPAEMEFTKLLTNATMVGKFSIDGRNDRNPQPERYTISSVRKTGGNNWIVQARITYGKYDLPVPVPVQVEWAGDTPVLQVTDLKIPLMGDGFTARVMFYKDRYAGSWYHNKVGGHMWGAIEHEADEQKKVSE